jgi:hypothetical protein
LPAGKTENKIREHDTEVLPLCKWEQVALLMVKLVDGRILPMLTAPAP